MTERLSNKNPCNDCKVDRQIGNPNRWECECDRCDKPNDWKNECVKKLAEYETAEEEGRLVVLPCSPKDTLYFLVDDCDYPNDCGQNRTCNRCEYRNLHVEKDTLSQTTIVASLRLFGKTIFLTKEEAEKALEEMKK